MKKEEKSNCPYQKSYFLSVGKYGHVVTHLQQTSK